MVQSEDLKAAGQQEQQAGQAEVEAARAQGYAEGTKDRVGGLKDSTLGAVTGDKEQQAQGLYHSLFLFPVVLIVFGI
jgi:hypothetical protein